MVWSWKLDSSTARASALPDSTASMTGVPMLPTAGAVSPWAARIAESMLTVVVLPSVPVRVSQGTSGCDESCWILQASSTSLQVSIPAASALRRTGPAAGTPGETTRSRAGESASAAAVVSPSATVAETTGVSSVSMEDSRLSKTWMRAPSVARASTTARPVRPSPTTATWAPSSWSLRVPPGPVTALGDSPGTSVRLVTVRAHAPGSSLLLTRLPAGEDCINGSSGRGGPSVPAHPKMSWRRYSA